MKKIILLLVFITAGYFLYQNSKANYETKVQKVDHNRLAGMNRDVYWLEMSFSASGYDLDNQMQTMVPEEYKANKTENLFLSSFLSDALNNTNCLLQYIPLYNRHTLKKESAIFLSAGIDGSINNNYSIGDTIYDDEYLSKFQFYNDKLYFEQKSMDFNLWNFWFGSKDYLVRYYNCIEDLNYLPRTLEHHTYSLHPIEKHSPISIIAAYEKDSIIDNKKIIVLKSWDDNYRAFCKIHKPNNIQFNIGDTLMLSGYVDSVDIEYNFHLNYCAFNSQYLTVNEILDLSKLNERRLNKRTVILKNIEDQNLLKYELK